MVHSSLTITCLVLVARFFNGIDTLSLREFELHKYVITRFEGLSDFYEELTSRNPQLESHLYYLEISSICAKVFGANIVVEPDDPDYTMKLKNDFPTIFEELFVAKESRGLLARFQLSRNRSKITYTYDNRSKPRSFLVNGREREEITFACVTKNLDETQFKMYFVSDYLYNINEAPNAEIICGRFIFLDNQLHALAEEPMPLSYINRLDMVRAEYRAKKNGFTTAENSRNDPICGLESGKRFRLCTHIRAHFSEKCDEEITVNELCEMKGFWLENELYYEWMITCKMPCISALAKEFSIARAYTDNEAFVFRFTRLNKFQLFGHLERVSFLADSEAGGRSKKMEN